MNYEILRFKMSLPGSGLRFNLKNTKIPTVRQLHLIRGGVPVFGLSNLRFNLRKYLETKLNSKNDSRLRIHPVRE